MINSMATSLSLELSATRQCQLDAGNLPRIGLYRLPKVADVRMVSPAKASREMQGMPMPRFERRSIGRGCEYNACVAPPSLALHA
jgi:hypothetical protein